MKNKVLVTGIGGFLGSHCLSHILVNTDWDVVGIDSWRHKGISERVAYNEHYLNNKDRVNFYTHDLNAPISYNLMDRIGFVDYIINFASDSHVDRSIEDPVPFVKNNVNVILNMMEYARRAKPKKFIQIGTDEVYGPTDGIHEHAEWSSILPSNPYSASKSCQDDIAMAYWRTYSVPVILTNIMNQFGEMQDCEKFVPKVIKCILNDEELQVHSDPDGSSPGSRFWLHTRNTSDILLFLINKVDVAMYPDTNKPERFNIMGQAKISNLDVALMIAEIMGKKLKYKLVDAHTSRPGHDLHYGLDGEKLRKYGYEYKKDLEESMVKMVNWTLKNKRWLK